MATARPVVSVYDIEKPSDKTGTVPMPAVLTSPLRPDLVRYIHTAVSKNKRQAYAVTPRAGYETAAESWGTGRAVARIPRAPGGGTHRAGQAAFGNQARGGGMFCPTKVWRRWHRRVNVTQKRHAVATCLAASTLPPLVTARGHRIGEVSELPLVLSNSVESVQKTKQAAEILDKAGLGPELQRLADSRKVRTGKGKMRKGGKRTARGPLVVYDEDNGIVRAFRNLPGVETMCVSRMNLLKLAPGGSFGRLVVWTEGAFKKLDEIYGSLTEPAPLKKGYTLPRAQMENADVARIINSTEVQSVLKPKLEAPKKFQVKKNPLKNASEMAKLNPGVLHKRRLRCYSQQLGTPEADVVQAKKKARMEAAKKHFKECKKGDDTFYKSLMAAFDAKAAESKAAKAGDDEEAAEEEEE